ncbi:hypothetical protein GUITHDRAFT_147024 [Guillardia theta CCMP2712]|uniref:Uncharacterized protein n=1 Tax=Guillardia theta (strain CCMP2712) TaxID=905079 RepID=L1IEK9_GUITC|nr:hypothetical protein GUITHDRAFT_147024 [Guillardia theta CCMP2712]EKX34706.1 hypothetical protein GUITHDRAFT_147024 [Guillardia theta CCMP2712]|eukprot:XP_005821686.1 hypothetical protein GUITHDRAFT_147024 [Guillardia theta CCMP2712]
MASTEQACYLLLLLAPESRNCLLRDVLDREQHDMKVMFSALIRPLVVHLDEQSVKLLIDKTMTKTAVMLPSDLTDLVRHVMPGISFLAEREAERGHAEDPRETRIGWIPLLSSTRLFPDTRDILLTLSSPGCQELEVLQEIRTLLGITRNAIAAPKLKSVQGTMNQHWLACLARTRVDGDGVSPKIDCLSLPGEPTREISEIEETVNKVDTVAILALLHPRLLVEKMVMEVAVKRRQPSFAFSCLSTFSELLGFVMLALVRVDLSWSTASRPHRIKTAREAQGGISGFLVDLGTKMGEEALRMFADKLAEHVRRKSQELLERNRNSMRRTFTVTLTHGSDSDRTLQVASLLEACCSRLFFLREAAPSIVSLLQAAGDVSTRKSSAFSLFMQACTTILVSSNTSKTQEHLLAGLAASTRSYLQGMERKGPLLPLSSCAMLKDVTAEASSETPFLHLILSSESVGGLQEQLLAIVLSILASIRDLVLKGSEEDQRDVKADIARSIRSLKSAPQEEPLMAVLRTMGECEDRRAGGEGAGEDGEEGERGVG